VPLGGVVSARCTPRAGAATQINLQVAASDTIVVNFVTVSVGGAGGAGGAGVGGAGAAGAGCPAADRRVSPPCKVNDTVADDPRGPVVALKILVQQAANYICPKGFEKMSHSGGGW